MSLKEYAKKNTKKNTSVLTTRIPSALHDEFKRYCEDLGLTVSEAIQYLIKLELTPTESIRPVNKTYTKPKEVYTKPKPEPTVDVRAVFETSKQQPTAVEPEKYVSPFDRAFDTFIQQEEDTCHSDMLDSILNEEPDPMDEKYFYILRKTFATDLPEDDDATYNNGAVYWTVPKDCCVHRDIHNEPIPFRYSLPNDIVIQPTQSQLAELKKIYGKPVTVEQ